MPRQEFTSPEPKSDIYSLMMVLSAVFVLAAIIMTYIELAQDYKFGQGKGGPENYSPTVAETIEVGEEAGAESGEEAGGEGDAEEAEE